MGSHGGWTGFGSWLWSCIISFTSATQNTVRHSTNVEISVENLDPINSKRITVEMCDAAYGRQSHLYEHEMFQPLQPDAESLPCADDFEDGEQPVDDENPHRRVEGMGEAVDVVEPDVDDHCGPGHESEPLQPANPTAPNQQEAQNSVA